MFPIHDHNPSGKFPLITYALIAINIVVFLFTAGESEGRLMSIYDSFAVVPAEIIRGIDLTTLFTSMFLHGGFMHLFGNMLFLYIFGDNLEARMGKAKFIAFYLISGLAASGLQIMTNPESTIPNIGASGAIAGIMGGYLWLYPSAKVDMLLIAGTIRKITMPAFTMLGYWFLIQLVSGTASFGAEGGGVAYWAHAGGFIAGFLMVLPLKKKKN